MRELDLFDARIHFETLGEHTERSVRHVIVTHVQNLEITLRNQALFERLNLGV